MSPELYNRLERLWAASLDASVPPRLQHRFALTYFALALREERAAKTRLAKADHVSWK